MAARRPHVTIGQNGDVGNNVQRRHHTVARVLLQGFADDAGQLLQLHRSGAEHRTATTNASVRGEFYTVTINGAPSTLVEEWLATDVEDPAAETLLRARTEHIVRTEDRRPLARFAAASLLRTQAARSQLLRIGDDVGPLTLLHYALEQEPTLGDLTDPTQRSQMIAEATAAYKRLSPLTDNTNALLRVVLRKTDELAQMLTGWEWTVHRGKHPLLLTGDSPAVTVRTNTVGWNGALPAGAPVFLPISPTHLIVGTAPEHRFGTTVASPTTLTDDMARASNSCIMREAAESVFRHPATPLPPIAFPPTAEVLPEPVVTWSRSDPAGSDVGGIVTDADLPPVEDARIAALLRAIQNVDWPNGS